MHGRRSHLPGLDGLRGLAAIGVVVLHVWIYTGANDLGHNVLLDAVIGELRVGLMAFFVMSAFLLVRPWIAAADAGGPLPQVRAFVLGRAARILPAYWAALIGTFVLLPQIGSGRAASLDQLPLFAALAQFQTGATRSLVLPQAWSLAVELCFYLLLPAAGWMLARVARRAGARVAGLATAATLVAAGLAWCTVSEALGWPVTATASMPTYLPIFGCGIAAAALPAPRSAAARRAILAVGALIVLSNGIWHSNGTGFAGHVVRDLPAGVGFGMVVAALAGGRSGLLEYTPIRWVGVVSYGLYLWHLAVLWVLLAHDMLPNHPAAAIVAVLLPSLALGAISWYCLERPILRWAGRRIQRASVRRPHSAHPARGEPSMQPAQ